MAITITPQQSARNASDTVAAAAWSAETEGGNPYVAALVAANAVRTYTLLFHRSDATESAIMAADTEAEAWKDISPA